MRPSAAWRDERQRLSATVLQVAFTAAVLVNIALARPGHLQLLLLLSLSVPAGIFARAVRDVTRGDASA
jgi:hypothetical protein